MTAIEKDMLALLIENKVLRNTRRGIVDANGEPVGYVKTVNKRYIEDVYIKIAKELGRKTCDCQKSKRE